MFDNADVALGLVGDLFFHCFLNRGYRGRSYKIKFHFKGKVIHERCIFHPFCIGEKPRNILSCFSFFFFSYFFVNTVLTQIDVHTTMNFKSFFGIPHAIFTMCLHQKPIRQYLRKQHFLEVGM